jgi:hypothetical protein
MQSKYSKLAYQTAQLITTFSLLRLPSFPPSLSPYTHSLLFAQGYETRKLHDKNQGSHLSKNPHLCRTALLGNPKYPPKKHPREMQIFFCFLLFWYLCCDRVQAKEREKRSPPHHATHPCILPGPGKKERKKERKKEKN